MTTETTPRPELIYVGDPMCSWCWGFSPTLKAVMSRYPNRFDYSLVLGGLRPGPTAAKLDDGMKAYIAHHWQEVARRTGQAFNHAFLERDDFTYDTEPSCRAVVTARRIAKSRVFEYMESVHDAFYARNLDPTQLETFLEIAESMGLSKEEFQRLFESDEIRKETQGDFELARRMAVSGFPSLLLREGDSLKSLTQGWVPLEQLGQILMPWTDG